MLESSFNFHIKHADRLSYIDDSRDAIAYKKQHTIYEDCLCNFVYCLLNEEKSLIVSLGAKLLKLSDVDN